MLFLEVEGFTLLFISKDTVCPARNQTAVYTARKNIKIGFGIPEGI